MRYLKRGFSASIGQIKENKGFFIILLLLQFVMFLVFFYLLSIYQAKFAAGLVEISNSASGDIITSYRALMSSLGGLLIWVSVLFVLLNGVIWTSTHRIIENSDTWRKSWKKYFKQWIKYVVGGLIFLGPFVGWCYYTLHNLLSINPDITQISQTAKLVGYSALVAYYLFLVWAALINHERWKVFLKNIWEVIQKIHLSFLVMLINLVLLGASLYVFNLAFNSGKLIFLTLTFLLLIIVMTVTRIFWVSCLQEIAKE